MDICCINYFNIVGIGGPKGMTATAPVQVPRGGAQSSPEAAPKSRRKTRGQEESGGEEFPRRQRGLGWNVDQWTRNIF